MDDRSIPGIKSSINYSTSTQLVVPCPVTTNSQGSSILIRVHLFSKSILSVNNHCIINETFAAQ